MWAVSGGHTDVVRALLESGADVHARTQGSQRPVSTAARVGVVGGTLYDFEGVVEVGAGGYTPLLLAAQQGHVASAELLIAAGANVNDTSAYGTSALASRPTAGIHGLVNMVPSARCFWSTARIPMPPAPATRRCTRRCCPAKQSWSGPSSRMAPTPTLR